MSDFLVFTGIALYMAATLFGFISLIAPNWRWLLPATFSLIAGTAFFLIGLLS